MRKPVIAVDVDEVLFPTMPHLIDWYNKSHSANLHIENVFTYDLWHVWGTTREEAIEKFLEFFSASELMEIPPIPGAVLMLEELKKKYKLVIITARQHELETITLRWLDKYFPGFFDTVLLANHHSIQGTATSKFDLCKSVQAEYLIDDSVKNITECAQGGVSGLLFGDYPWNPLDKLPNNVVRVKTWPEVGNYFQENHMLNRVQY